MARIVDGLIAEIEQEAATTRRVLERVPGDKFDWKPHDKSMSLGELSYHIALVPGGIAELVQKDRTDESELKHTEPQAPDQLIANLDESVAKAKSVLDGMDDDALMKPWGFYKDGQELMSMPKIALIRSIMMNHWYHHRGQLSVYLRLLNVPLPSIYGPSADENPFA